MLTIDACTDMCIVNRNIEYSLQTRSLFTHWTGLQTVLYGSGVRRRSLRWVMTVMMNDDDDDDGDGWSGCSKRHVCDEAQTLRRSLDVQKWYSQVHLYVWSRLRRRQRTQLHWSVRQSMIVLSIYIHALFTAYWLYAICTRVYTSCVQIVYTYSTDSTSK